MKNNFSYVSQIICIIVPSFEGRKIMSALAFLPTCCKSKKRFKTMASHFQNLYRVILLKLKGWYLRTSYIFTFIWAQIFPINQGECYPWHTKTNIKTKATSCHQLQQDCSIPIFIPVCVQFCHPDHCNNLLWALYSYRQNVFLFDYALETD